MFFLLIVALTCGTELWPQKTLTDPGATKALAVPPVASTIAKLIVLPVKSPRRSYSVTGIVTAFKHETDSDFHIVLDDAGRTMIVEVPAPECATGSKAYSAIVRARKQASTIHIGNKVKATGMIFFDFNHGQLGRAPNGVELHPLYSIVVVK